jgi:hypothetical protein
MKYMSSGGFAANPLMRVTLLLTLGVLFALWITNAALYLTRMGLDPRTVVAHYRGSEEAFVNPRTFGSMLEVTHAHLATMAVVVLLLTHLGIFLPWSPRAKLAGIVLPFTFLLLGEAASWLVRWVAAEFAILKVVSFLGFQISLLLLLAGLARLLAAPQAGRAGRTQENGSIH